MALVAVGGPPIAPVVQVASASGVVSIMTSESHCVAVRAGETRPAGASSHCGRHPVRYGTWSVASGAYIGGVYSVQIV